MSEKITALTIMETMKKWVEDKHPISPSQWLDASAKLNILRGDLDDFYFELESELANKKKDVLSSQDISVAKVDVIIKAENQYLEMRKLGGVIGRLEEFIKIAKKQASLKNEEWINSH